VLPNAKNDVVTRTQSTHAEEQELDAISPSQKSRFPKFQSLEHVTSVENMLHKVTIQDESGNL
jgi:hypothetical protein